MRAPLNKQLCFKQWPPLHPVLCPHYQTKQTTRDWVHGTIGSALLNRHCIHFHFRAVAHSSLNQGNVCTFSFTQSSISNSRSHCFHHLVSLWKVLGSATTALPFSLLPHCHAAISFSDCPEEGELKPRCHLGRFF